MKCVVEYLEASAKKYKDKIAVIEENEKITYKELLEKSRIVGSYLSTITEETKPIGIFMDKGINTLVSFFGVVYSGCFYSLINPEYPNHRIESIIETLNSDIIITNEIYYEKATSLFKRKKVLKIENLIDSNIDEELLSIRMAKQIDTNPLYINFTSGSTGTPKGVVVANRSVLDFIDEFTENFNITNDDIIANQAPFDFDVSVKDIYSSIKVGATLLIVPKSLFSNPTKLLDYLVDNKVTTLIWAVSALCLVTTFHGLDYKIPESIKKVIFSGEVMPKKHLDIWMSKLPLATFINVYGPTEITCNCTYHIIDPDREYKNIPIGIPFKNEHVFLLDENDHEITESDVIGEICVKGTCLSLGYYNNKEETEKHFIQNPLNNSYNELIYRTGDLGYIKNGEFYFQGRKDFQIKYMGHRIELEEIESSIEKNPDVIRSCVIFDENKSRLYAFYIGNVECSILREYMIKLLPNYMIPSKLIKVEKFELTKNGKIDRTKLKESINI